MQSLINRIGKSVLVFVVLAAFAVSGAALSGCNTTEGVGKDIKAAGKGIENAADKAK